MPSEECVVRVRGGWGQVVTSHVVGCDLAQFGAFEKFILVFILKTVILPLASRGLFQLLFPPSFD